MSRCDLTVIFLILKFYIWIELKIFFWPFFKTENSSFSYNIFWSSFDPIFPGYPLTSTLLEWELLPCATEYWKHITFFKQEYTAKWLAWILANTLDFRPWTVLLVKTMIVFKVVLMPFCSLRLLEAFVELG